VRTSEAFQGHDKNSEKQEFYTPDMGVASRKLSMAGGSS
jgi:hypothetical protein